jgi:hypothetical protein
LTTTVYTLTASDGTCLGSATIQIVAKPVPTISMVLSSTAVCLGQSANITVSGGNNYTWTPSSLSGGAAVVSPTTATLYQVIGDNSVNCTAVAQGVILVNLPPVLGANFTSTVICPSHSVTMVASGGSTYTWNTGVQGASLTVSPVSSADYTVIGSGQSNTCTATKVFSVTVATPTLAVSAATAACEGAPVTLTVGPGSNILWNPGGSTFPSLNLTADVTTEYTVTADVVSDGITCPAKATVLVTVNSNPSVTASSSRSVMCKGESVTLNAGGASTYAWSTSQTGASVTFSSAATIQHMLSVVGTDTNGCTATATVEVKVNLCNGIAEQNTGAWLQVYPVPSNGEVKIEGTRQAVLQLCDAIGRRVRTVEINAANSYRATLEGLQPGVYFIIEAGTTLRRIVIE